MSSGVKNIAVILGLVTIAFAGYYLYTQQGAAILTSSTDEATMQTMLASTRSFMQYRRELEQINYQTDIFNDQRFTSLRSFDEAVPQQPYGRANPFVIGGQSYTNITTP